MEVKLLLEDKLSVQAKHLNEISLFLIYGVYFFITSLIVAVIGLIFEKNKRFNKLNWISVVISGLTSLMFFLMYLGIG